MKERVGRLDEVIKERRKLNHHDLEKYANYILESKDIESGRKVEYSYFVSEKEMRKYKEFSVLLSNSNSDEEFGDVEYMIKNFDPTKIKNKSDAAELLIYSAKHFSTLELKEKKGFLSYLRSAEYLDIDTESIDEINNLISKIAHQIKNDMDYETVWMFMYGMSEKDIAASLEVSISNVNRRIGRILNIN